MPGIKHRTFNIQIETQSYHTVVSATLSCYIKLSVLVSRHNEKYWCWPKISKWFGTRVLIGFKLVHALQYPINADEVVGDPCQGRYHALERPFLVGFPAFLCWHLIASQRLKFHSAFGWDCIVFNFSYSFKENFGWFVLQLSFVCSGMIVRFVCVCCCCYCIAVMIY